MTTPYILAKTIAEAHAFAQETLGLSRGHYRLVMSVGTLKAVRGAKLYLVPGWEKRYDRFALQSALRWTRMEIVDTPSGEPDGLEPAGTQLTIADATDFVMVPEPEAVEPEAVESEPEAKEPEPEKKRRRRRCNDCGTLHFKEETCPSEPLPGV